MNPPMNEPERDDELEQFLRRRSPMHRRLSDIDHAEPSIELDRLVLSRARDAIETPAQPPMFRGSRWAMPAGLAATILIVFILVLNVEHQPKQASGQQLATAVASVQPEAAPAVTDNAGSGPAAAETLAKAPAAEVPSADARAGGGEVTAAAPPPFLASNNAVAMQAPAESKAEGGASRASVAAAAPVAAADAVRSDAETWLREIARLRAEGKNTDADRELAAFRRAYPSHTGTSLAQPPTR